MIPTIEPNQLVLVDESAYKNENPSRFDIVAYPNLEGTRTYVHRIVGLPFEKVRFSKDGLFVNDKLVDLPSNVSFHIFDNGLESFAVGEDFYVPENQYFMIGDNMKKSMDSRFRGSIPFRRILGQVVLEAASEQSAIHD